MMDGVLENFTGAMIEPYLDASGAPTANRGLSQIDPEGLKTWVPELDRLGFQPHFHAIGDRAVRESLDAVAAARAANGPSDTRPRLIAALEMLQDKRDTNPPKKHGNIPL